MQFLLEQNPGSLEFWILGFYNILVYQDFRTLEYTRTLESYQDFRMLVQHCSHKTDLIRRYAFSLKHAHNHFNICFSLKCANLMWKCQTHASKPARFVGVKLCQLSKKNIYSVELPRCPSKLGNTRVDVFSWSETHQCVSCFLVY